MNNSKSCISNSVNVLMAIGSTMLFIGVVCNQWLLAAVFSPDGVIEDPRKLIIWLAEFLMITTGMTFIMLRNGITRKKIYLITGTVSIAASFFCNDRYFSIHVPLHDMSGIRTIVIELCALFLICVGLLLTISGVGRETRQKHRVMFLFFSSLLCLSVFCVHDFYLSYLSFTTLRTAASKTEMNVHVNDELLGWSLKSGSTGTHLLKGDGNFDVKYEIDENGFKKIDNNSDEPDFSIYFFGDSFTFGVGVDNKDTFPNIIKDSYLKENINVFNAGVMAYGIVQMFQRYLNIEDRIKLGDLVIFTPFSNDIKRNIKDFRFPYNLMLTNVVPTGHYPVFSNGVIRYHKITNSLYNKLKVIVLGSPYTGIAWRSVRKKFIPDTTLESIQMIDIIRQRAEMKGAKFLLVFIPHPWECKHGSYLVDISAFKYTDIMSYFPSDKVEIDKLHFRNDSHWNSRGHQIAAEGIVTTLVHAGLISEKHLRRTDILRVSKQAH